MADTPSISQLWQQAGGDTPSTGTPGRQPTIQELWDQSTPTPPPAAAGQPSMAENIVKSVPVIGGPIADMFFNEGPLNRIAKVFGQSFEQNFGAGKPSPELEAKLRASGAWNDYNAGQTNIYKGLNETIGRAAIMGTSAAVSAFQATGAAIEQTGGELMQSGQKLWDQPDTGFTGAAEHTVGAIAGAAGEVIAGSVEGYLPESLPEGHLPNAIIWDKLNKSRANGVIGEDEPTFWGTKTPEPEDVKARNEAVAQLPAIKPDVHTIARTLEPEVFDAAAELRAKQDAIREELANREPNHPDYLAIQKKIDQVLAPVKGNEEGLSNRQTRRLAQLRDELADTPKWVETPESAALRKELTDATQRLWDLQPTMKDAYKRAGEELGTREASGEPVDAETAMKASPEQVGENARVRPSIKDQVNEILTKEGMDPDQASTNAALVERYYQRRANRLGMDPFELFDRSFPNVRRGEAGRNKPAGSLEQAANDLNNDKVAIFKNMELNHFLHWPGGIKLSDARELLEYTKSKEEELRNAPAATAEEAAASEPHLKNLRDRINELQTFIDSKESMPNIEGIDHPAANNLPFNPTSDEAKQLLDIVTANLVKKYGWGFDEKLNPSEKAYLDSLHSRAGEAINDNSLEQAGARGRLDIVKRAKNILNLFHDADASTFMHEMAHQFLQDMREDWNNPNLGAEHANDIKIVHDWIGLDPDKVYKPTDKTWKRAHEKFASGFEKYLMEGRAPSTELAQVFAKFKAWLTDIYNVVSNIKNSVTGRSFAVSQDVKDVFARLLEEDPNYKGVTITPDEKPVKAEPAPADLQVQQPEQTQPGDPLATGRQSKEELDAANPQPADDKKDLGGAPVPPESMPQSQVDTPESFHQSKLYDQKSGFDFANITSDRELAAAMDAFSAANNDWIKDRKGTLTETDQIEMAGMLGESVRKTRASLKKIQGAMGDPTEAYARVIGLKIAMIQNTVRLKQLALGDDLAAFADAQLLHMNLFRSFHMMRTSWAYIGHALSASEAGLMEGDELNSLFQSTVGLPVETVKANVRAMKFMDTPEKVSKQVRIAYKPTFGDKVLEWTRMNYITGPLTHSAYSLGNKLFALYRAVPETAAIAGFSALKSMIHPETERVYFREVPEQFKELMSQWLGLTSFRDGMISGKVIFNNKAGYKAVRDTFMTGELAALPREGTIYDLARRRAMTDVSKGLFKEGSQEFEDAVTHYKELKSRAVAQAQAQREGLGGVAALQRIKELMEKPDELKTYDKPTSVFTKTKAIEGKLGVVARAAGERFVAPIHAFDRAVSFEWHRRGFVTRMAIDEGKSGVELKNRILELMANTPDEIMAQARDQTWEDALLGQSGDFTRRYQTLLNYRPGGVPIFGFLEPFVSIPSQIVKSSLYDRGPLGVAGMLFKTKMRDDVLGRNGDIAQANAVGKLSLGIGLGVGLMQLGAEGLANGPADKDWKKQSVENMVKGLPDSIRIGDMTYDVSHLGALGAIAKFWIGMGGVQHLFAEGEYAKAVELGVYVTAEIPVEVYGGFADVFDAINNPDSSHARNWVKNFVLGGLMPGGVALKQIADVTDPYKRQTRSFFTPQGMLDSLKQRIPGWSRDLPPQRDLFGNPVPNKGVSPNIDGIPISPFLVYSQRISTDPVAQWLIKQPYMPGPTRNDIKGVQLNPEQYDKYQLYAGMALRQELEFDMSMADWDTMSDYDKHNELLKAVRTSRKNAQNTLTIEYPEIQDKIDAIKDGLANAE